MEESSEVSHQKINSEQEKLELEIFQLKKPWYRRINSWIAVLSAIAALVGVIGQSILSNIQAERVLLDASRAKDDVVRLKLQNAALNVQNEQKSRELLRKKEELESIEQLIRVAKLELNNLSSSEVTAAQLSIANEAINSVSKITATALARQDWSPIFQRGSAQKDMKAIAKSISLPDSAKPGEVVIVEIVFKQTIRSSNLSPFSIHLGEIVNENFEPTTVLEQFPSSAGVNRLSITVPSTSTPGKYRLRINLFSGPGIANLKEPIHESINATLFATDGMLYIN